MHGRKQIRKKLVEILTEAKIVKNKVFNGRVKQIRQGDLPCIIVSFSDEISDGKQYSPRRYKRESVFVITVAAFDKKESIKDVNIDDVLDDFAEEIENALEKNPLLDGYADHINMTGTKALSLETSESEYLADALTINVEIEWQSEPLANERETSSTDLESTWAVSNSNDDNPKNKINLEN